MNSGGSPTCSASSRTSSLKRSPITSISAARSPYFVPYPIASSVLFEVPKTRALRVFA